MIKRIYEQPKNRLETGKLTALQGEFRNAVNLIGIDNDLNIPDLVLAKFLTDMVGVLGDAIRRRDRFLDIDPRAIIDNPPQQGEEKK